jgi:hypothetical protein
MSLDPCACMGPQGNDPVCPCIMKSRGLEPSNQWTEKDKQRLHQALGEIFKWRKENDNRSCME